LKDVSPRKLNAEVLVADLTMTPTLGGVGNPCPSAVGGNLEAVVKQRRV